MKPMNIGGTTLSKDQVQKLLLGAVGVAALIYIYFSFFLGPLNKSRKDANWAIENLQGKIANSETEMNKAKKLEQQAGAATQRFAALKAYSPEGAPIAWFPPRIKSFFAGHQVDKATARMETTGAFKEEELADWTNYAWLIEVPQAGFAEMGTALAALENAEPLLTINKINMRTLEEAPEMQATTIAASTALVKQ